MWTPVFPGGSVYADDPVIGVTLSVLYRLVCRVGCKVEAVGWAWAAERAVCG